MRIHIREEIERSAARLPASLRAELTDWTEALDERHPDSGLEAFAGRLEDLLRLVASSQFAAGILLRDWDRVGARGPAGLALRPMAEIDAALDDLVENAGTRPAFLRGLRRVRNRGLVRVLWHDLVGGGPVETTLAALSALAESLLDAARRYASAQIEPRFGPAVNEGESQPLIVLAMGKLGGRELNFSSDIDLVFLYPAECQTSGPRTISAHEFFAKVARETVALLEETTSDGFVYRVDTRLRPFGKSGPPVVSFAALESYLVEHGRGWERYAYVKARPVTGTAASIHADRLMADIVRPFVYRRYLDYGVFESLRDMQTLIAGEVRKRELADDVKLGPGGIREIEFIVQSLQLVRGGGAERLRTPELRSAMSAAVGDKDLSGDVARRLTEAYDLLRRVENAVQAIRDQQTHRLPASEADRDRLTAALGYPDWPALLDAISEARRFVSAQFRAIGRRDETDGQGDLERKRLESLWSSRADAAAWQAGMEALGLAEAERLAEFVAARAAALEVRRLDAVAAKRVRRFIANLLLTLKGRGNPETALHRTVEVAESVYRRSAYLALLNENPQVLGRLVDLCERSRYLSSVLVRHPVLLDELIDARIFDEPPAEGDISADLSRRLADLDESDTESRVAALADFKRATMFRIAVADFAGSIPLMKVSDRLTELAERIIAECLTMARSDLLRQFGEPTCEVDGVRQTADLGVIAYGKLAGLELSYSSDLDLVFVHDSRGAKQRSSGARSLDNQVYFSRLVRRLVHFLTTPSPAGILYEIDTRLRPSGRSGLLVSSIDAFERYQKEDAWTWEHQALLRSRPIAGSAIVAREFRRIRSLTLRERVRRQSLKDDVLSMRRKMRAQLDRSAPDRFDLKQGEGGIADIEFLVQYRVLLHAGDHPAVFRYPDNIRQLDALADAGYCRPEDAARLQDVYRSYRAYAHRQALDELAPFAPQTAFAEDRDFVTRLWRETFGRGDD